MSALHNYNSAGHVMITNYDLNDISSMEAVQKIHLGLITNRMKAMLLKDLKQGLGVSSRGKRDQLLRVLGDKFDFGTLPRVNDHGGYIVDPSAEFVEWVEPFVALQDKSRFDSHARFQRNYPNYNVSRYASWYTPLPSKMYLEKAIEFGDVNPDHPGIHAAIEAVERGDTISIHSSS